MSDDYSPLPEFFHLLHTASRVAGASDVMPSEPVVERRQALVSLIDFIREYDVTILAKLDE